MRIVYTTELKVDIDVNDDKLRKAFIDLVVNSARAVYGPATMLSKAPPVMNVTAASRDGVEQIPLFETATAEDE